MEITSIVELDAVNEIISVIGESPLNTLENIQDVDAINALRILRAVSRNEQSHGWSFNIRPEHILTPDRYTGRIAWLETYLSLKGTNGEKLVRSGDYIKDLSTGAMTFTAPITAEAIILVPFEELPEAMRNYVIAKATYKFQSRYLGDDSLTQITLQEIQEAWRHLQEYELDNNEYNILVNADVTTLKDR